MNRHHKTMFMLAGLVALAVSLLLVWCPPALCRALNLHTFPLSDLSDFRQYVEDEPAFLSAHRTRAVRIDCAALRDEIVNALQTGRLTLETGRSDNAPLNESGQGTIEAWHQGRLLHLTKKGLPTNGEQQAWATSVRIAIARQQGREFAFLSRLFGGVVLHVAHKLLPIVLFSDHPCA